MHRLEVSCAVRPIYGSLGGKGLIYIYVYTKTVVERAARNKSRAALEAAQNLPLRYCI
jgi:hypothetical protein